MTATLRTAARSIGTAWNHPGNRDSRISGVTRLLRFWAASRIDGGVPRVVSRSGIRAIVRPGHYGSTKLIYGFPPDYDEMRFWQRFIRPGDRFIDVGANVGLYSLWAASLGAQVDAFEPSSDSWSDMLDNFALNGVQVNTHKVAVGDRSTDVALSRGLDTMNHVVELQDTRPDLVGERVPMVRLDAVVEAPIRGLKIDVEGYEYEVLVGATGLLQRQEIDIVQFEWNQLGVDRLAQTGSGPLGVLDEAGYRLIRLRGSGWVPLQPDAKAGTDVFALSEKMWESVQGA